MMQLLLIAALLLVSYLSGAIPSGMIVVKLRTGKDLRQVESGRTGGTNAARAAGWPAGVITGVTDFFKGALPVFLARAVGVSDWVVIVCPLLAILGHNYSIFLIERDQEGRPHFKGGAGGATCMGGAFGLWPASVLIILPFSMVVLFGLGYASVATMSMAGAAIIVFALRAWLGYGPWIYVFYGVFAEIILMWALRPNIRRLALGTERLVGWRAKRQQGTTRQQNHA
jgi:acyl phosphate:glycerol-3-phosphate acyltransferase